MSRGVNKVIIVGRLGDAPKCNTLKSGDMVVNMSIATSEKFTDRQGQLREVTEWHKIVLYGKTADIAAQYLAKGSEVYVEGKLKTRKWQDKNGQDRYSTEIIGNNLQFLGGKPNDNQPMQGELQPQPRAPLQKKNGYAQQSQSTKPPPGQSYSPGDQVPF